MKTSLTRLCVSVVAVSGALVFVSSVFGGSYSTEKNVAPMQPAPACDWSGFYVGINAGVTDYVARFSDDDDWESLGTFTYDTGAFVGGGHAGYNLQFGQLVLGAEIDANGSTAEIGETVDAGEQHNLGRIDFVSTLRGRLGVAFDKALVYVTGGGAYAHGKWNITYGDSSDSDYALWRGEDWRWGFCSGIGVEYMLNCHWSIRAESLIVWLFDDRKPITGGNYPDRNAYHFTFDDDMYTGRVGVSYNFGSFFGH